MKKVPKQIKLLFIFLIALSLIKLNAQTQIGNDIDGLTSGDSFGRNTSISADGSIVAIAGNIGEAGPGGSPRVFKNINGAQTLYATDSSGGNFGGIGCYSISMSSDGNTLAIGTLFNAIRVFSYDSNTDIWIQKGADIVNTSTVNRYGYSTQLSSDGNIIAIGIPDSPFVPEAGITQIYQYNTGAWSQIANNIVGLSPAENSGRSVDLSSDGNTVAILSDNTLRVYQNVSGNWTLYGNEIPATGSQTTNSAISLSSNGTILALGEPDYTGNFIQQDRVRIFKYRAGLWEQIGDDIIGEVTQYRTGWSVSLSEGGDFIAIGEPGSTSSTTDTGRMRFFKNQNDSWIQVGNSIFGEASEDYSGRSVALSFDAGTVIIGAPKNDDGADNAGHARVYNLNDYYL